MGMLDRLSRKLREAASAALAPAPDPRVVHLTSHQKQRALLDEVATAIKEVIAARERLEMTAGSVKEKLPALQGQARAELEAGRPTMARLALQRRQVAVLELQTLERQLAEVEREEASLCMIEQKLSTQIEAFAARQQVIRARYSAAEAQVRINEAVTGVSEDFADLASALQRAEEKTQSMQARATAIDRLVENGDLETIALTSGADMDLVGDDDDLDRQLAALAKQLEGGQVGRMNHTGTSPGTTSTVLC